MDTLNQQMFSLIGQTLFIYLALLLLFWLMTRTTTPEPDTPSIIVRLAQPVLFFCGLFTLYVIGGLLLLIVIVHLPDNFITTNYPAINRTSIPVFINQLPESDSFMLPMVLIMLAGLGGLVWLAITAKKRLYRKAFGASGGIISRVLRRIIYVLHMYALPVLCFIGMVLVVRYDTRLTKNLATLPDVLKGYAAPLPLLALSGLFMVGSALWLIRQVLYGLSTYGWSKAEGVVTVSRIGSRYSQASRASRIVHFFDFRYSYHTEDSRKELTGKFPNAGFTSAYESYAYAWYQTQRYPVTLPVTVYYNPNNPEQSVLIRGIDWYSIISRTLLLMAASFFVILYLLQVRPV